MECSKAIQAAALLLGKHHGRMSQLRLLKLLYIANREALRLAGTVVIDDRAVAMQHGPVLSRTYDTMKNETSDATEWNQFIGRDGYTLELQKDPGNSKLSRFEIELLQRIADDHCDIDDWQLVELTHQFPEWIRNNPGESSKAISLDDILDALGLKASSEEIHQHLKLGRELERNAKRAG